MGKIGQAVETKHDRKALARDAGLGRVSAISVLVGALCGLASLAALLTIAATIGVAIHGGTDFSTTGDGEFKAVAGVVLVASSVVSFLLAGYAAGRMARRSGAGTGLLAGFLGVILVAAVGVFLKLTHGDVALARMASRDIHVVVTWHQWRYFSLIVGASSAAAMMVAGLLGGIKGERWHSKLLGRAIDPSHGPEAVERETARQMAVDAERARLDATRRVAQVTAVSHGRHTPAPAGASTAEAAEPAEAAEAAEAAEPAVAGRNRRGRGGRRDTATAATPATPAPPAIVGAPGAPGAPVAPGKERRAGMVEDPTVVQGPGSGPGRRAKQVSTAWPVASTQPVPGRPPSGTNEPAPADPPRAEAAPEPNGRRRRRHLLNR